MKRMITMVTKYFSIALGLIFLFSCASVDQQKQKVPQEPPPGAPVISEEAKQPKPAPKEIKEQPRKASAVPAETPSQPKAAPKAPPPKAVAPPPLGESVSQQNYYDMGMRYYSQEKYADAKKAWQRVIKLGRRTALANKARENIKKVDQILKTLKEMSGK
jgi:outer membrane biosynthesis protein TonB